MRKLITLASFVALVMASCSNEEPNSETNAKGRVFFDLALQAEVEETRSEIEINCTTPAAEAFKLTIEGVDNTYKKEYANIAAFNADGENYLHIGTYKATVVAGDLSVEGYDKATFVGSKEFTVSARENTQVDITAYIANTLVKVETTEAFDKYFVGGAKLTLTTAAGNSFDVSSQAEPIFIAPAEFKVSGTAVKQSVQSGKEGATVTLPEYKMETPAAKTCYTVKFDLKEAGGATIEITLNDNVVVVEPIDQELNDNAK